MVLEAIELRHSVRNFSGKTISDEILSKIVDAGRLAPSWINVQPWKFIIVKDAATKEFLSGLSGGQQHVKNAAAVICVIADFAAWEKKNFGQVMKARGLDDVSIEGVLASPRLNPTLLGDATLLARTLEQTTYATAYMTLAAHELGVGACVIGAVANEITKIDDELTQKARQKLNLKDKEIFITMLALGYEKEPYGGKKQRKPREQVVFQEKL